jgi:hypothetical protein
MTESRKYTVISTINDEKAKRCVEKVHSGLELKSLLLNVPGFTLPHPALTVITISSSSSSSSQVSRSSSLLVIEIMQPSVNSRIQLRLACSGDILFFFAS